MSIRTSVHIPDHIAEIIDLDRDAGESLSGRISTIIERYSAVCAASIPPLSEDEWMACMDVMNGMFTGMGDAIAANFLWASVSNAVADDDLAEKWGIDGPALVDKLRQMTAAQLVSLTEVARRFWQRSAGKDGTQALQRALASIKRAGSGAR